MLDEILTIQEVADYLKVSRTTVWRWCQQGKLSAFKAGRSWRIHRVEVEKMVGQTLVEPDGAEGQDDLYAKNGGDLLDGKSSALIS